MRRQSSLSSGCAGDDGGHAVAVGQRGFGHVEPQVGLPGLFVEAVALEAVFGKDRPDVAVEVELRLGRREAGPMRSANSKKNVALHDGELASEIATEDCMLRLSLMTAPR